MKKFAISVIILCTTQLIAQNDVDALRYSQQDNLGTARYVGMGGAFSALGGDLSSIKENPAATAVYRVNEFGFSMGFHNKDSESNYYNSNSKQDRTNFNIPSFSLVKVDDDLRDPDWKRLNLSFGLTRLKSLSGQTLISAQHNNRSLINSLKDRAQDHSIDDLYYDDLLAYMAFNTLGIDTTSSGNYVSWIDEDGQRQKYQREERGGITELNLSVGASYKDKMYFGASLNFPIVNYESESMFSEYDYQNQGDITLNGVNTTYNRLGFQESIKATGSGVNAKFGLIAKPVFWWRFGLAYHTPTYYTMDEEYSYDMTSYFGGFNPIGDYFDGNYSYNLRTPGKVVLGTSIIVQKQGIISVEYNYSDYSSMEYSSVDDFASFEEDEALDAQNKRINQLYTSAGTLKIGAEWRYDNVSLRGGYNHVDSPLKNSDVLERDVVSFGLGYRWEQYFVDMAVQHTSYNEEIVVYEGINGESSNAELANDINNYVFTFGYKF